jgi:hypothetical protein
MTVTAPSAGVMVVRSCGSLITDHVNGTAESLHIGIQEDESVPLDIRAPQGDSLNVQREGPTGGVQLRFCVERHFPVGAGAKTFYLRARRGSSGEFWDLSRSYISALFVASTLP